MTIYTLSLIELIGNKSFMTNFIYSCDTFDDFKDEFITDWLEFIPYTANCTEEYNKLTYLVDLAESASLLGELLFYSDFFILFSENGVPA